MSERVTMPALGESVTEGTVTRWLKNVGDSVEVDEPLLEVSTDKVDTEIPSPVAGTLLEIKVEEDETVEVGAELAIVGSGEAAPSESGEDTTQDQAEEAEPEAEEEPEPEPEAPAPAPARKRDRREVETGVLVRAQAKYVRTSARKARLVCDHIRGKDVVEARAILAFTPRAAATPWLKLLESAVANAEHNHELVGEDLKILAVHADEGPTLKRFRPRAMGRATRIRKRTSHLTITLTPKER